MPTRPAPKKRQANPVAVAVAGMAVVGMLVVGIAATGGTGSTSTGPAGPVASIVTTTTSATLPSTTTTTTTPADPIDAALLQTSGLPESAPATFEIVYEQVENELGSELVLTVERPLQSIQLVRRDGALIGGQATSTESLYFYLADRTGWLPTQAGPHRPGADVRLSASVGVYEALGLFEFIEDRTYAERTCRLYRTGKNTRERLVTAPSPEDTTELCIDDAGLVLHEAWAYNGSVISERTAISVEIGTDVSGIDFDPTPIADNAEEYAALTTAFIGEIEDEHDARLAVDVTPPAGFAPIDSVRQANITAGGTAGATALIRFFAAGADLVRVSEFYVPEPTDLAGDGGIPLTGIDGWDDAYFLPSMASPAIRLAIDELHWIEIDGPDPRLLLDFVAGLVRREAVAD